MEQHELIAEVLRQYVKMRNRYTVEADVEHNSNYELNDASYFIAFHVSQMAMEDKVEYCRTRFPHWDQEWLLKTLEKTYKERLIIASSLLIAEIERVMYLENKRNDSNRASSETDPESDGPGERPAAG